MITVPESEIQRIRDALANEDLSDFNRKFLTKLLDAHENPAQVAERPNAQDCNS